MFDIFQNSRMKGLCFYYCDKWVWHGAWDGDTFTCIKVYIYGYVIVEWGGCEDADKWYTTGTVGRHGVNTSDVVHNGLISNNFVKKTKNKRFKEIIILAF